MKRFLLMSSICLAAALTIFCGPKEPEVDFIAQQLMLTGDTVPLVITHVSPVGKTESIGEAAKILIGFNQPMVPLSMIEKGGTRALLNIEPRVKGRYRWLGTRTLAFIPDDTLPAATRFEIRLDRDKIRSLTGMALDRDTSWSFETVRPALIASIPYHGEDFVEPGARIYLRFNVAMSAKRARNRIKIYYTKGVPSKVWGAKEQPGKPKFRGDVDFTIRELRDAEKKEYPLSEWNNNQTLVLVPKRALPVESRIEIALHAGLLGRTGNLGTEDESVLEFNTYNEFTLLEYDRTTPAENPLRLVFSNPVVISDVVNNIKTEPPIEIPEEYQDETWSSNEVYLFLPFIPNSDYEIMLSQGLKDIYGNRLDKLHRFRSRKADYTPHVEIPTGISIAESKSDLRFPLTLVNVDSVHLQMKKVDIDQAVPLLNAPDLFWSRDPWPGFFDIDRMWRVSAPQRQRNEEQRLPIELKDMLGPGRAGFVFMQIDNLGQSRYREDSRFLRAFVEVSDIGMTWKYSPENNFVCVTSLNDARPLKGARVQLRDNNNRILWQGSTDAYGFCMSPGWADPTFGLAGQIDSYDEYGWRGYDEPMLWLTILNGNDAAVYSNQWSFGIDPWRFNISYDWWVKPVDYQAFIFTEKGLYRSGETVHVKGMIRKKVQGQWKIPDMDRVIFTVHDPQDEVMLIDTLRLNGYGSFFRAVNLDPKAVTGIYSIRVSAPDRQAQFYESFRVEAFRPAEFEVKITSEQDTFLAAETFRAVLQGKYLFGMPMKNAPVAWNLRRSDYHIDFPAHEGYDFGEYTEGFDRAILASGEGKADDRGEFRVSQRLNRDDITTPSVIYLEGVVTAPNMTAVAGEQNWLVLNAQYLVGLKASKYLYTSGDTCDLGVICVDKTGNMVSGRKVTVEIYRQEWKSIKKARLGGRYEWISEQVETKIASHRMKTGKSPVSVRTLLDSPGYYFARASARDDAKRTSVTRTYFYAAGKGQAGWQMRDDDIIELVADQDEYDIGDTARIMVKSPYDSARCLVTIERELVMERSLKTIHGNADFIDVPINPDYAPNVYVCVALLRGRVSGLSWDEGKEQDLGKPQFKVGYVNLKVNADEKRLRVFARPDRTTYEPRDTVAVSLEVRDHAGKAVANTEVALFCVDVGVLNLINFQTPDPFEFFYSSRPLSVRTVESRVNILGERSYGEKGKERGGGGMYEAGGVSYRERFISTPFYKADVKTDQQGRGMVRFALPDNLTKFRIMAVAQAGNSLFGSVESTLVVARPFMMTLSVPRFCRQGDKFKAGVVLHNGTGAKQKASVRCNVKGLRMIDPAEQEAVLEAGASREVLYRFEAQETGEAVFEFDSRLGEERDGVRTEISVNPVPLYEAVATFSSTEDSAIQAIIVPSQIHDKMGGLEITLAPTFIAGMEQSIDFLWNYRYYCLEQLLSKILPVISAEKMIDEFNLAPVSGRALRDTVQAVLDRVADYQTDDGGFVYFKGSRYACPYLSAYTLYVLHRAQAAGYAIDRASAVRAVDFLSRVLRWKEVEWTYPYSEDARLNTLAFSVYTLALWGRSEHAYATQLFGVRSRLSIFAKTLLLRAGRILNMGGPFETEIVRDLLNKVKVSPTSAHFEEINGHGWTFPSRSKATAAAVSALIELEIPFSYLDQAMQWLVRDRKAEKPTTHDNAFVFDAFRAYYNKYEREEPSFSSTVILNGEEIVNELFRGRTRKRPAIHNVSFEGIPRDTLLHLKITKHGTGRLYYTLRMSYAPLRRPYAIDNGFYVTKEILSLEGRPVKKYRRGEVYRVKVRVITPETRQFAVVDDPLPAGFVPVQTYFATEAREISTRYEASHREEGGPWWGSFDHTEYYDDRVVFFAQELAAGEHVKTYFVRAASSGHFLAPPTHVMEMYASEVFGTSVQADLVIE